MTKSTLMRLTLSATGLLLIMLLVLLSVNLIGGRQYDPQGSTLIFAIGGLVGGVLLTILWV